ncbi:MAG: GAF domain-containing protein [Microscillaceae bacterium]|jgi:PAS domain S-box-containing protein|nr:GAF domain-containing protein [Microscillaceae bacterium]
MMQDEVSQSGEDKYKQLSAEFAQKTQEMQARQWIDSSIAQFDELIRLNYNKSLLEFADVVLDYSAEFAGAYSGVIYIINPENNLLEAIGSYAYDLQSLASQSLELGQGLVGQAAESQKVMKLDNIPAANVVMHSSATFQVNTVSILILPLVFNQKVFGVIELIFVANLDDLARQVLERVGRNIAIMIESISNHTLTQKLLQDSQQQTEALRAQEEELRQNMEELKATQEAMAQKQAELEKANEKMKASETILHKALDTAKKKEKEVQNLLKQTQEQTEALRAQEEELRQNMEELHSTQEEMYKQQILLNAQLVAINNSTIAKAEYNAQGILEDANETFCRLMQYPSDEIRGKNHRIFVSPKKAQSTDYQQLWQELRQGNIQSGEFERINQLGDLVWISGSYVPVVGKNGEVEKIIELALDITQNRKMTEDLKAQAQTLKTQEEEMRETLDGMMATQEEMARKEKKYQDRVKELEAQLNSKAINA